jgi:hypothetical protein
MDYAILICMAWYWCWNGVIVRNEQLSVIQLLVQSGADLDATAAENIYSPRSVPPSIPSLFLPLLLFTNFVLH